MEKHIRLPSKHNNLLYHLNVKTTTFPKRNLKGFIEASNLFNEAGYTELNILQVGPGMALKGIGRFNNLGKYKLIKRLETGLRRIPFPVSFYETYEPREVLSTFSDFKLNLTIADISPKSLDVARRTLPSENLSTVRLDLTSNDTRALKKMANKFDLIVCVNTVARTGSQTNKRKASKNLNSFAKEKSVIISEANLSDFGFSDFGHAQVWTRSF